MILQLRGRLCSVYPLEELPHHEDYPDVTAKFPMFLHKYRAGAATRPV